MNRRNPTSRNTPGRNRRSVTAFASDSASASSCRLIELALAASVSRIRAPSEPAKPTAAASSVNSDTPNLRPNSARASHGGSPASCARTSEFDICSETPSTPIRADACNAPSIPIPPARHKTTRLRKDPTARRAVRLACRALERSTRTGRRPPQTPMARPAHSGTTNGRCTPPAVTTIHHTPGRRQPALAPKMISPQSSWIDVPVIVRSGHSRKRTYSRLEALAASLAARRRSTRTLSERSDAGSTRDARTGCLSSSIKAARSDGGAGRNAIMQPAIPNADPIAVRTTAVMSGAFPERTGVLSWNARDESSTSVPPHNMRRRELAPAVPSPIQRELDRTLRRR